MTPILTCDHEAELTCDRGTMRMILMGALADANLWTRATGASQETKNHWARRSTLIRGLLEQLPKPVNPRDPYEDLPGEPMPEEADRIWRERAAQEDARSAARRIQESSNPDATREIIRVEQGLPTLLSMDDDLLSPDRLPDDVEDLLAL